MRSLPLLAFLCCACASTPVLDLAPLPEGRAVAVQYASRLAPHVAAPPGPSGADPVAAEPTDGTQVRIGCRLYAIDAASAPLTSAGDAVFGRVLERAAFERTLEGWMAAGAATTVSRPSLVLPSGRGATLSVLTQIAYVAAFDVKPVHSARIADPNVATVDDGFVIDVRARAGEPSAPIDLDVALRQTELVMPLLEGDARLPGTRQSVTIQVPIALRQDLAAQVALGAGDVLVLGGLFEGQGGRRIVAVFEARVVEPAAFALARDR